jgi:hypothetical protein
VKFSARWERSDVLMTRSTAKKIHRNRPGKGTICTNDCPAAEVAEYGIKFRRKSRFQGLRDAWIRSTSRVIVTGQNHRMIENHCSICEVGAQK